MELATGTRLTERLTLQRRIGSGGMGDLWVARHLTLDVDVAVKLLHITEPEPETMLRFSREARAVAKIGHPHVVHVLDFGLAECGRPFLAMELLEGEDLRTRIEQAGPLSLRDTATILTQVAGALSAAHAQGVIHRDVKPANIFLVRQPREDAPPFAKLLDFGVAKQVDMDLDLTTAGALLGTPYYMSPEQLLEPSDVDPRSDLWSLAVVIYACLTGTLPFLGNTLAALSLRIASAEFAAPSSHRPELALVDDWMRTALARDPDQRFDSADDLAAAFVRLLESGEPAMSSERIAVPAVSSSTPSSSSGSSRASAEPPTLAPLSSSQPARSEPASRDSGSRRQLIAAIAAVVVVGLVGFGFLLRDTLNPSPSPNRPAATQPAAPQPAALAPEGSPLDARLEPAPSGTPATYDVLARYEEAVAAAKAEDPSVILRRIAFVGRGDGTMENAMFKFATSVRLECVKVKLLAGPPEVSRGHCKLKATVPPPRCSLDRVLGAVSRLRADDDITLWFRAGPDGEPEWLLNLYQQTHHRYVISDDC